MHHRPCPSGQLFAKRQKKLDLAHFGLNLALALLQLLVSLLSCLPELAQLLSCDLALLLQLLGQCDLWVQVLLAGLPWKHLGLKKLGSAGAFGLGYLEVLPAGFAV